MNPIDYVIISIVLVILGCSAWFIHKSRKNGKKCIGCPDSGCPGNCGGCSHGCGGK